MRPPRRRPQQAAGTEPATAAAAGMAAGVDPSWAAVDAALSGDPAKQAAPIKGLKDKYELLPAFLKVRGLVRQHIDSFNYLVEEELRSIVRAKGNERVSCDVDPSFYLRYTDVFVGTPCKGAPRQQPASPTRASCSPPPPHSEPRHLLTPPTCRFFFAVEDCIQEDITPQQCRLRDMTYAAPITVDVEYTRGRELVVRKGRNGVGAVAIGSIPLMLRSSRCVLAGKSEAELARLGECPLDPGGYFVVRGVEKVCREGQRALGAL